MRTRTGGLLAATLAAMLAAPSPAQELVLSVGPRGYGEAVEPAIESFEAANPGIIVEWLKISDVPNESRKLYVTNLTAAAPTPDVFTVDIIWPGEFAQRGWLMPLTGEVSEDDLSAMNPAFMEAATVDGDIYGLPLYVDGTALFYRSDLLEKYGLEPPETWEELIAAANTVLEGENDPDLVGFVSMWAKIEGLFMNWLSFTYANGNTFFDEEGNPQVNSPEAVEATQFMVDMLHEEGIAPESILSMRPDDARTLFQQGRAIFMMVQDFVYAPFSAPDSPVADKFDFTRNPYFEGHEGAPGTAMGGYLVAVNANTEHPDAAVALARHLVSYNRQLAAALDASKSPGRQDVYADPALADAEVLRKFGDAYAAGVVRPSAQTGTRYPQVSEIMQLEVTNALYQNKAVQEALDDAQAQIEGLLSR